MIHKKLLLAVVFLAVAMLSMPAANASNFLFILDASGSMWGKVDGEHKIETAKAALTDLFTDLPADSRIGLMVYGHRRKGDCKDIEMIVPIGSGNSERLASALAPIKPLGKTPLSFSLLDAAPYFNAYTGQDNQIVLITDGIETCGGAPCAVAGAIAGLGIGLRTHVVGFDISKEDRKQLECIAEEGGGQYFPANSTEGFADAVRQATQVAQAEPAAPEAEPEPVAPQWKVVFKDDFDGEYLADHWQVLNPDPDAMIVENGELLVVSASQGKLEGETNTIPNMLVLDQPLPKGDWRMTMRYRFELGTTRGWAALGLFKDPANRLQAHTHAVVEGYSNDSLYLNSTKISSGSQSGNSAIIAERIRGFGDINKRVSNGLELRLLKQGRSYISQARLVDDPEKPWISLPKLTSLRPIGPLFIAFSKGKGSGEDLIYVDRVTIEELTAPEAATGASTVNP